MKKSITSLFLMLACAFGAQAQTESYPFDAADVDANGWLWFDTAEKIEKYVGVSKDGKLDPNGKIFQMITTSGADSINLPAPFNETFASDTITGFGYDDGEGNVAEPKKGAIVLNTASNNAITKDGGAVLIKLPSCKNMSMVLSTASSCWLRLSGTNDAKADTSAYNIVYKPIQPWPGFPMYDPLFNGFSNPFTWESIETLNDNGTSEFTLTSKEPVYVLLQNSIASPLYLHGIKVVTEGTTGINDITADAISFDGKNISLNAAAEINVYNLSGALVASEYASSMNLSNLTKGVYMVKVGNATQKVVIK